VRLLFVSGEYPPDIGGVGDYTHRLRGALAAQGWDSVVLSRRDVRRWDVRSLFAVLRGAPRDGVVHIQYQAGAFDLLGDVCLMPMLLRQLRPAVRVVTTFHDVRVPYLFPGASRLRPAAVHFLARTSHAVIAADSRDVALLGGPSARHHHIAIGSNVPCLQPLGFDRADFRSKLGVEPDALVVVYFGLLNATKGLDLLLDAFSRIVARCPNARLLLLGGEVGASDPTDRLTATRILARLDKRVIETGWLEPAALSAHLLAADVALLPYTDGASPRRGSLLACAEHRLPIVTTQPAAPEVAAAVHAVPPNASALSEAVLAVSDDAALAARLKDASRSLAEAVAWPSIAAAHRGMYESLWGSMSS
jgi:glycosyltransferase involved in cell wall biosynthesis